MGTCNHKDYNGKSICTVKNDLHTVSFFDVETKVTENIFLCQRHSDEIFRDFNAIIDDQIKKRDAHFTELKRISMTQKEVPYNAKNKEIRDKIKKITDLISTIRYSVCRLETCAKRLAEDDMRFSVTVFTPKGKNRFWFYFCSRRHYDICRARCGINLPIHNKQRQLDSELFLTQ